MNLVRDVSRILADAPQECRFHLVQPWQAKKVESRERGDTTPMEGDRIAGIQVRVQVSGKAGTATLTAPDGSQAGLRPKTAEVLCVLAQHAGEVVSRDELTRVIQGLISAFAETQIAFEQMIKN